MSATNFFALLLKAEMDKLTTRWVVPISINKLLNNNSVYVKWVLFICFSALFSVTNAQQTGGEDPGAKTQVIIIHADRLNMQKANDTTQLTSLGGNAEVQQDSTLFLPTVSCSINPRTY